jgi:DNA-directed RNA polymerase specialized sigma24 family protein
MNASAAQLLHNLRRLTAAAADSAPDAELLERFVRRRDEAAFAALVARHGPMVLHVCQRGLGDAHAAEDCFQATFLILARKACSVRHRDALAAWLFGVAARVARKARIANLRARGVRMGVSGKKRVRQSVVRKRVRTSVGIRRRRA